MTKQLSYSKYENRILPAYRQKINHAESAEDVKKFFTYTAKELLQNIFAEQLRIEYEDLALTPDSLPHYMLSDKLLSSQDFITIWNDSDLPQVMARLARPALNRYRRLEKHPEKTDAKIRM